MRIVLILLCLFLSVITGVFKGTSLYAQQARFRSVGSNVQKPPPPPGPPQAQVYPNQRNAQQSGSPPKVCDNPQCACYCQYATPGCYPSAPICGTACGVSYLSMGIALALVAGVAAIILSSGDHVHSH